MGSKGAIGAEGAEDNEGAEGFEGAEEDEWSEGAEEDEGAAMYILLDGYDTMGKGYIALWGFGAKSGTGWVMEWSSDVRPALGTPSLTSASPPAPAVWDEAGWRRLMMEAG